MYTLKNIGNEEAYELAKEVRKLLSETDKTLKEISEEMGISLNLIEDLNAGKIWKETNVEYPIRK
jgi:hypothetical protein